MKLVYFNNAATSWPKPSVVATAMADCVGHIPCQDARSGLEGENISETCRERMAALLNVREAKQIVFGANATHALNVALHGFPWRYGASVVTTAAEHNSVLRPLYQLAKTKGLQVHVIPVDVEGRVVPEVWREAMRQFQPALAVFSHASNVTGAVNDAMLLGQIAREAGAVTLLDASQTAGFLPVYPETWQLDMVAFTGHKYLLGPGGTGGLYLSPAIAPLLQPVWVGGTGIHSNLEEMPSLMPQRFEAGTPNNPGLAGLSAALAWRAKNTFQPNNLLKEVERLCVGLTELGADVIDVARPRTPVVSFTLPKWRVETVGEALQKSFGIVCRTGVHCAPNIHAYLGTAPCGTVRFSFSRFTQAQEIDYCLHAVHALLT